MATEKTEFKAAKIEFKASGDGNYEGHFSIFKNLDDGWDVMHPGAFLKTIAERKDRVKVFYGHDWEKLVGPAPTTLQEDTLGLFAAGKITTASFWGKEVWELMKDNALNEGSIGYEAVKFDLENPTDGKGYMVRNLREVKLYEISFVPLGMNPLTQVNAMKSALSIRGGDGLIDYMTAQAGSMGALVDAVKAGRMLSAANREKVQNARGALEGALDVLKELLEAADADSGKAASHSALLEYRLRAAGQALAFTQY